MMAQWTYVMVTMRLNRRRQPRKKNEILGHSTFGELRMWAEDVTKQSARSSTPNLRKAGCFETLEEKVLGVIAEHLAVLAHY